jgi:23S rRNA pseudouridine1911/1915/1917 synthase
MEIKIIYEDDDLAVIEKPAGLLSHPVTNEKDTLIDLMKKKYPEARLVHRLDKDTSGLMVIAKNEKAYEWLKSQFLNRQIHKKYLALANETLKDKKGIIVKSISKSRKRGGSQTTAPIGKMREALTRYEVIKEFSAKGGSASGGKNYTLLEVSPETGRTHQIRIHLASIGHPLAGDDKYKFKRQLKIEGLNRQFLHASYLQFQLLDGKIMEFKSRLPEELNKALRSLCPLN